MLKFKQIIVKEPGKSVVHGLTTANLGQPDYDKAILQHREYIRVLQSCGVEVKILPPDEDYPDSCFVEDPAVVTEKMAIITNPGAPSRNGETIAIKRALEEFFDIFEYIRAPGTLEGGDVMRVENHFYIGLSNRTNAAGANQFINIVSQYGFEGSVVPLKKMLLLKTGVNYIGDNTLLVAGEFIEHPQFCEFNQIVVDEDEMYAANCIRINDYVVMPAGFPKTEAKLVEAGFLIKKVHMSEFQKIDGGLSCLSLRF
ncbi:MAG TPA: arginine deiminase family protein [Bacillota bacterium]|nr:arginine deiminase family protein [Bacillota bacterium]